MSEMREEYNRAGYVIVRGALSPEELAALQAQTDVAVARREEPILFEEDSAETADAVPALYKDETGKVFRRLNRVIDRGGAFESIVTGSLAEAAAPLLPSSFTVCLNRHNMLMLKAPHNPAPVLWHQDAAVWNEGTFDHVCAIVAVDDFRVDNGALEVVPGSHREGPIGLGWGENTARIGAECAEQIAQNAVPVDLKAGDAVFFHGLLLHGSGGNASADTRRSLTVAYYPGDLRQVSTKTDPAPEVRAIK